MYRDVCCYRRFLDRRRGDLAAAAAGAVGVRDYGGAFDTGLREKLDEGWDGEVRFAAEEDAHGVSPNCRSQSCSRGPSLTLRMTPVLDRDGTLTTRLVS